MRSAVAVVGTRPETVREDYARLLRLIGAGAGEGGGSAWVAATEALAWPPAPAAGSPPWQLDGTLAVLAAPGATVTVGHGAGAARAREGYGWSGVIAAYGAELVSLAERDRTDGDGPSADLEVAAERLQALRGRPAVLLATARTDGVTGVGGAVAMGWADLVPRPGRGVRRRRAELLAAALEARRAAHPRLLAVIDAAVVGVGPAPDALSPVQTHVLLASEDPVAVDAVFCRWLGRDPLAVPHLRACADRGLGRAAPREIRLRGETALLDRAPGVAPDAPAGTPLPAAHGVRDRAGGLARWLGATPLAPVGAAMGGAGAVVSLAPLRRRRDWRRFLETGWGRLWQAYLGGMPGAEERS
ncbi:MAG: DUF362 domain-containing protein [Candidatus Krumholzibacteriia bacterium]